MQRRPAREQTMFEMRNAAEEKPAIIMRPSTKALSFS
jgi:hypothetical protein